MKLVVAMTGATGAPIGVRVLEALDEMGVETHLVISRWARATLKQETGMTVRQVEALATTSYRPDDQGAAIASGSYRVDGMVIVPCSMKTLAGLRIGYGDGLIGRAGDVTLKERRKLVLVTRETPLSAVHLDNMLEVTRMGAVVVPPMLTFYNRPQTIDDLVEHIVARILDQFDLDLPAAQRWTGMSPHNTTIAHLPNGDTSCSTAAR